MSKSHSLCILSLKRLEDVQQAKQEQDTLRAQMLEAEKQKQPEQVPR